MGHGREGGREGRAAGGERGKDGWRHRQDGGGGRGAVGGGWHLDGGQALDHGLAEPPGVVAGQSLDRRHQQLHLFHHQKQCRPLHMQCGV